MYIRIAAAAIMIIIYTEQRELSTKFMRCALNQKEKLVKKTAQQEKYSQMECKF